MNEVVVDARGLDKRLAGEIARRAIAISGGCPVVVTVDPGEPEEAVRNAATLKKRTVLRKTAESNSVVLELVK